jgi:twin BRCT domain
MLHCFTAKIIIYVLLINLFPKQESVRPPLKVKDLGSTYGTYINAVSATENGKIEANTWVSLSKDSTVHFGVNNEWSIKWMDVTVLCSAMAPSGRRKLTAQLVKLGARQIADWNDKVTHLVMEKVVFTHKVNFNFTRYYELTKGLFL